MEYQTEAQSHFSYRQYAAKGVCWYCNQRLSEMRRFCDRNCAEAFEEDETAMDRRIRSQTMEPALEAA